MAEARPNTGKCGYCVRGGGVGEGAGGLSGTRGGGARVAPRQRWRAEGRAAGLAAERRLSGCPGGAAPVVTRRPHRTAALRSLPY